MSLVARRETSPSLVGQSLAGKAGPPQADHLASVIFGAGNQMSPPPSRLRREVARDPIAAWLKLRGKKLSVWKQMQSPPKACARTAACGRGRRTAAAETGTSSILFDENCPCVKIVIRLRRLWRLLRDDPAQRGRDCAPPARSLRRRSGETASSLASGGTSRVDSSLLLGSSC